MGGGVVCVCGGGVCVCVCVCVLVCVCVFIPHHAGLHAVVAAIKNVSGLATVKPKGPNRTKEYPTFTQSNCRKIVSTTPWTRTRNGVGQIGNYVFGICESTTAGCIVLSDYGNNRIQELSLDGSQPTRVVAQFKEGSHPCEIAACGDGTTDYIVAIIGTHQVTRFSSADGSARWTVGTKGSGSDNFYSPRGVVVLPNGQAVVADKDNNRLQVLDAKTGRFIKQLG